MKLYHATFDHNVVSIKINGIRPGIDGRVYLASDQKTAAMFLRIRGIKKCSVVEVDLPAMFSIHQSEDHNQEYFKSLCPDFGQSYFTETTIPHEFVKDAYHIQFQ